MFRRDNMIRHKLEVDADCLERNGVSYKDQLLDALEKNAKLEQATEAYRRECVRLLSGQKSLETIVKAISR